MKQQRESYSFANRLQRSTLACALCLTCLLGSGSVFAQQPPANPQHDTGFPDGPGKDALLKTCSRCHSPNIVMANGQSREGWEDTITKMVSLGAVGTDEDFTAILDYLVKNFPVQSKVNVNKATAAELQSGLSLSAKEADAVIAYRNKNGDFKSFDDLKKVPLLDAKKIDEKRSWVTFQ